MMIPAALADLPLYHDDHLIVKLRPHAASVIAAAAASGAVATGVADAPGLSALAVFERAGLVKRVVPLVRKSERIAAPAVVPVMAGFPMAGFTVAGIMAGAAAEAEPSPTSGYSIVELQGDTDAQALQRALAADANVEYVGRVPTRYLAARLYAPGSGGGIGPAGTPPPASSLWNMRKIRWDEARAAGLKSAAEVRVSVLDTGLDTGHPDLPQPSRYTHDYGVPGADTSADDVVGHGTHVAGTICALINNEVGINGVCECTLSAYKIFKDTPTYSAAHGYYVFRVDPLLYHEALIDCAEAGEQVVNLSIAGYGTPDQHEALTIQALIAGGVTVVAAMGNENTSTPAYPAAIPGVIAVGATSINDARAGFSNVGSHITISAPGVGIWSTLPTYGGRAGNLVSKGTDGKSAPGNPIPRDVDYGIMQGTSMAAPHVTAAAALAIATHGPMSAADVRDRLLQAADPVPGMGNATFTAEYGCGRLNLMKLV